MKMKISFLACAIALAASAGGCKNKKADCERVAQHVAELATVEIKKRVNAADPALRERLKLEERMVPIGEASARDRCQKERWSRSKFDCIMAAQTMSEVGQCD